MNNQGRTLVSRRPIDPGRNRKIALVLSSLVLGLLVLFNLDRNVNQSTASQLSYNASLHGWPMVYLQREFEEDLPNYARHLRSYDWPFPPVEGEVRTWRATGVIVDLTAVVIIVTIIYWFIRQAVGNFDHWIRQKKKQAVQETESGETESGETE